MRVYSDHGAGGAEFIFIIQWLCVTTGLQRAGCGLFRNHTESESLYTPRTNEFHSK